MSQQSQPVLPAMTSLQSLGMKKQQVMLPDERGILRLHQVSPYTAQHLNDLVTADKRLFTMGTQQQFHIVPTMSQQIVITSTGSVTSAGFSSTSSVASIGSQRSTTSDR